MQDKIGTDFDGALEILRVTGSDPILEHTQEINDLIALRAYELFEAGGCVDGFDREHWLRAESEILTTVPIEISETEKEITVRAEVPGFKEKDLELRISPLNVSISGKRKAVPEQKEASTTTSERRATYIYCSLTLRSQIDTGHVVATLSGGVLEIKLAKIGLGKKVAVLEKAAGA